MYVYFSFLKSVDWIKRMYRYRNTEEPVHCESQSSVENSNNAINKICKKD